MAEPLVLTLACSDRPGITARVTGFLFERGANILDAQQFNDRAESGGTDRFFMRVVFDPDGSTADGLRNDFAALADEFGMEWKMAREDRPRRTIIMVSKFDHCLVDLIYRWRTGELAIDPVAIVSNHPREAAIRVDIGDIPFHHIPVTPETKPSAEASLRALAEETGAELVVLARYMQVFSDELSAHFAGRAINIHHSFLPGFKGARPYHQAHARGVKIIGATAHFVTADLDEGPIIHQDVERITHADSPEDLVRKGRDIERRVLAEAVRLFAAERVLMNGGRTVVFRG
ncbi:formyltetrahydrofolate deformylase [Porphyrobacter sp. CACIAM 03H1]|jgi:formyltetrahydrofolate deformylase|uniref:formyltetrahydrofolate deformylase n=1 Tax=Porphyrobacter sp. CACIAM 03H1 TaxID=2003315 RepID=UPI000B5A7E3A|nr:formyltetrahydrofolate deformylase [Porphyrobacter sp. CACIAM 03H1]ASJ89515.1 formyltetrahydrofolate deformylase [Porphyrobacter sp. CACIAM 03H1]